MIFTGGSRRDIAKVKAILSLFVKATGIDYNVQKYFYMFYALGPRYGWLDYDTIWLCLDGFVEWVKVSWFCYKIQWL